MFWFFIGGGIGSVCRFLISEFLNSKNFQFPFATLLSNSLSSLVLGILVALFASKPSLNNQWWLILAVGFCGGFSTFSTFSLETLNLFRNNNSNLALLNIVCNFFTTLLCLLVGIELFKLLIHQK